MASHLYTARHTTHLRESQMAWQKRQREAKAWAEHTLQDLTRPLEPVARDLTMVYDKGGDTTRWTLHTNSRCKQHVMQALDEVLAVEALSNMVWEFAISHWIHLAERNVSHDITELESLRLIAYENACLAHYVIKNAYKTVDRNDSSLVTTVSRQLYDSYFVSYKCALTKVGERRTLEPDPEWVTDAWTRWYEYPRTNEMGPVKVTDLGLMIYHYTGSTSIEAKLRSQITQVQQNVLADASANGYCQLLLPDFPRVRLLYRFSGEDVQAFVEGDDGFMCNVYP